MDCTGVTRLIKGLNEVAVARSSTPVFPQS